MENIHNKYQEIKVMHKPNIYSNQACTLWGFTFSIFAEWVYYTAYNTCPLHCLKI